MAKNNLQSVTSSRVDNGVNTTLHAAIESNNSVSSMVVSMTIGPVNPVRLLEVQITDDTAKRKPRAKRRGRKTAAKRGRTRKS